MHRSDESIRLQNEVFVRTTDALQRIESSTGVTEKRIEDIISGRVGDLSHQIAEIASEGGIRGASKYKELEEAIRETITQSIKQEPSDANPRKSAEQRKKFLDRRREKRMQLEVEYKAIHEELMVALSNRDDLKIAKAPQHADMDGKGLEFFDAVFRKDDINIGVNTFRAETNKLTLQATMLSVANEIREKTIDVYLGVLFDGESSLVEELNKTKEAMSNEYSSKIFITKVEKDSIDEFIQSLNFSNNSINTDN